MLSLKPVIAKKDVTLHILKRFGIRMSKKLGQNFLVDPSVVAGIVKAAGIQEQDVVLEIGPGIGTLTQGLAETGAKVVAVELDRHLLDVLAHTLEGYENVRIVHGDILKIDILQEVGCGPFKVVANLPYYITTPIIMELLEARLPIDYMVTMVQKEVAERMAAEPGHKIYGALSVSVQYYTKPQMLFEISPKCFMPAPEVTSAVVAMDVRQQPPVDLIDEKRFFQVVKAAFQQRRKTFSNALKNTGMSKEQIAQVLEKTGIDGKRRGETLSLQEFADIANAWSEIIRG